MTEDTYLKIDGITGFYKGKVRDIYTIHDQFLVAVASNRVSAFDVILPKEIPYKGEVLNGIAAHFLQLTKHIVPNWLMDVPYPNVSIGKQAVPYKVEIVVRGYLAGHAWREYQSGKRELCGVPLPEGLRENDKLPHPIITPATKAEEGHDEDISKEEIINQKLLTEAEWNQIEKYALQLFAFGTEYAHKKGLILVDTKYEFGNWNHSILLIDEIHTPDSSRYFYIKDYAENQKNGLPQNQLSKEFVRQWLIQNQFMGRETDVMPNLPNEFIQEVSNKYIGLYELLTQKTFIKNNKPDTTEAITNAIQHSLHKLMAIK